VFPVKIHSNICATIADKYNMSHIFIMRPLVVYAMAALLIAGVFACKPKQAIQTKVDAPSPLSGIQQDFIVRQGSPDLFAVTFDRDAIRPEWGQANGRQCRRVDTWVYLGESNRMVVFDDGYLLEEQDMKAIKSKEKTDLKPSDFNDSLVKKDITDRFGSPDGQEFALIDGKNLTIMRYQANGGEPAKTFGFVGDDLVAVTIGFLFQSS